MSRRRSRQLVKDALMLAALAIVTFAALRLMPDQPAIAHAPTAHSRVVLTGCSDVLP